MNTTNQTLTDSILERKVTFALVFFGVFMITYAVLYILDLYPEPVTIEGGEAAASVITANNPESSDSPKSVSEEETTPVPTGRISPMAAAVSVSMSDAEADTGSTDSAPVAALPTEIYIERLDRTIPVHNPTSRSVTDLDAALLDGVVRHPDSATFTNEGTIFILGHSSYLPNVFNKNFQAFNGIQELLWGDIIVVRSADREYFYRVDKVFEARASELTVPIADTGPKLTLATCDSFGSVDDRFIVEATLVGTERL